LASWLHEQRLLAVLDAVRDSGATTLLDLGCGEGEFVLRAVAEGTMERIVGMDICAQSLGRLRERLGQAGGLGAANVELVHRSITEPGGVLSGFDCAVLIETIEHVEPGRLSALERSVFTHMSPRVVVVTTPNAEYNTLLGVPPHRYRHPDHRFEWDRSTFRRWAAGVATRHGYAVTCSDIAGNHPTYGGASQMAVFRHASAAGSSAAA
jgi:small RNA 2'-O-methyltransferase